MPPSNQINTTSVNTLRNTSPLIDRLMRIVPFEEIKETRLLDKNFSSGNFITFEKNTSLSSIFDTHLLS